MSSAAANAGFLNNEPPNLDTCVENMIKNSLSAERESVRAVDIGWLYGFKRDIPDIMTTKFDQSQLSFSL